MDESATSRPMEEVGGGAAAKAPSACGPDLESGRRVIDSPTCCFCPAAIVQGRRRQLKKVFDAKLF